MVKDDLSKDFSYPSMNLATTHPLKWHPLPNSKTLTKIYFRLHAQRSKPHATTVGIIVS